MGVCIIFIKIYICIFFYAHSQTPKDAKKTLKRRWILSSSEKTNAINKYNMDRWEALQEHLLHFNKIHDPFVTRYVYNVYIEISIY